MTIEELKKLKLNELRSYCKDTRRFLVNSLSKTGGHLGSNLGVVELTVALHYVFNSPEDKFIFDVGHQSYIHKILTGRQNEFHSLRKFKGLSGFPKQEESEHDFFDVGHSSNSISIALGYSVAMSLENSTNKGIAIIGDGAMTSGVAYEGLVNGGLNGKNLIVIYNDNEMSISKNISYVTKSVNKLRLTENYNKFKNGLKYKLSDTAIGNDVENKLAKFRDHLKYTLIDGQIYEEMGYNYFGPFDGHDLTCLINVLNHCKKIKEPVFIHVKTCKGKGYLPAMENPSDFHGVSNFNIKTGQPINKKSEDYSSVVGKEILKHAKKNEKVVAITAAMSKGTGLSSMEEEMPNRFFDVGIAESHSITFASSLAKSGLVPIVCIYSTFLQRAYDQVVEDLALQKNHAIICIDRGGLVGADGETHQGIFDISFLSHVPNLVFMCPKDKNELIDMIDFAVKNKAPTAIRYPRGSAKNLIEDKRNAIELGKSEMIHNGTKVAILSIGTIMETALEVYSSLEKNIKLINCRFVSPLDMDMIESLKDFNYVFTIEDNLRIGGFGSKVLNALSDIGYTGKFKNFGFNNFVEHGDCDSLYKEHGLDSHSIVRAINNEIGYLYKL
ncbi:MAG: 1-deoxy-D-xylulose-5-phosphate synthase [Lachnospirales bacterium]